MYLLRSCLAALAVNYCAFATTASAALPHQSYSGLWYQDRSERFGPYLYKAYYYRVAPHTYKAHYVVWYYQNPDLRKYCYWFSPSRGTYWCRCASPFHDSWDYNRATWWIAGRRARDPRDCNWQRRDRAPTWDACDPCLPGPPFSPCDFSGDDERDDDGFRFVVTRPDEDGAQPAVEEFDGLR